MIITVLITIAVVVGAYYFGKSAKGNQIKAAVEADLIKAEKSIVGEAKTLAASIRAKL
jgi:Na+/citrate or Na+/malate symporter